jgi:hypothetical protein
LISPWERQENYQRALAWVGEQITAAERQGLTLEYLSGWHKSRLPAKFLRSSGEPTLENNSGFCFTNVEFNIRIIYAFLLP